MSVSRNSAGSAAIASLSRVASAFAISEASGVAESGPSPSEARPTASFAADFKIVHHDQFGGTVIAKPSIGGVSHDRQYPGAGIPADTPINGPLGAQAVNHAKADVSRACPRNRHVRSVVLGQFGTKPDPARGGNFSRPLHRRHASIDRHESTSHPGRRGSNLIPSRRAAQS